MPQRTLVACLACRLAGSRLYGKPLQNLDYTRAISILGHQVAMLREVPSIGDIVLGIADGVENDTLVDFAQMHELRWIRGSEHDVLARLIACVDSVSGTDVFRITTESPFTYHEMIQESWDRHVADALDATVVSGVPLGCGFEIYTADALRASHERGDSRHRSELCSLYVREHLDEFRVHTMDVPEFALRPELRLTVDYPEDLVVCRAVYGALSDSAPLLPMRGIVDFLDANPGLTALLAPYASDGRIW